MRLSVASSLSRNERLSKFVEPTDTSRPSTIKTLQWYNPDLLSLPNVVLTPHIASASVATRRAMANLAADNLIAGLGCGPDAGRPPTPINREVLTP